MKITGNEPAFPFWTYNEVGYGDAVVMRDTEGRMTVNEFKPGLTIRQHFAALALLGILSRQGWPMEDNTAEMAVKYADALIKKLNETPNPNM